MIIDLILDRKDGANKIIKDGRLYTSHVYNAKNFYNAIMQEYQAMPEIAGPIASALDGGSEEDVKNILCNYIMKNDYNENICNYINGVNWIN